MREKDLQRITYNNNGGGKWKYIYVTDVVKYYLNILIYELKMQIMICVPIAGGFIEHM